MRIRILGAGWYGCHIGTALLADGHDVAVFDPAPRIFNGASGNIPARLHLGYHYPRSWKTRQACQSHTAEFLETYGPLTAAVPVNLYAVAAVDSLVDFGTYLRIMDEGLQFTPVDAASFGLKNCEGAVMTAERHIVTDLARAHFERALGERVHLGNRDEGEGGRWDATIDCTFCSKSAANVDRWEPCLTVLLRGPTHKAVTIMDGPFPSLYPWDEERGLCSLTSAKWTPLDRCGSYAAAARILAETGSGALLERARGMIDSMANFYPDVLAFELAECRTSIRAMPRSGSDARLMDATADGRTLRIRAGKIDAIFDAQRAVTEWLRDLEA